MTGSAHLDEKGENLIIIDQTLLPNRRVLLTINTAEALYEAIASLRVRGAPAIGIAAAYGMYVVSRAWERESYASFREKFGETKEYINSSRPTAVNLSAALDRMEQVVLNNGGTEPAQLLFLLKAEAEKIHSEDIEMCRAISEYGLTLVKDGDGILTHCNAGSLATSKYGTGLGTLFLGRERGYEFHVWCDETRPLLQGARLTAYELYNAGIDVTLICDNMASYFMKQGKINAVFVGCDRVAANGDTANKIGTSGAAVLAKYYGIPFYVFCPSSTIDFSCRTGADINIEFRSPDEIKTMFFKEPSAPEGVKCCNPAFDVTDGELITAIVTERGVCRPPYEKSLYEMFKK